MTWLNVAPSSKRKTASESPPSDCPLQAPEPLSYFVYDLDGVKVAPAATVIGLLKDVDVGELGIEFVAVRFLMLIDISGYQVSQYKFREKKYVRICGYHS